MKQHEREVYHVLANEVDFGICCFCKFSQSDGYSPCDCGEPYCTHPLLDKTNEFEKQEEQAANLGDCWGFRPRHDVSLCADIVGIILANGWSEATWWQNKKGQWKVSTQEIIGRLGEWQSLMRHEEARQMKLR